MPSEPRRAPVSAGPREGEADQDEEATTEAEMSPPYSSWGPAPGNLGFPRVQIGGFRSDPICQFGWAVAVEGGEPPPYPRDRPAEGATEQSARASGRIDAGA